MMKIHKSFTHAQTVCTRLFSHPRKRAWDKVNYYHCMETILLQYSSGNSGFQYCRKIFWGGKVFLGAEQIF